MIARTDPRPAWKAVRTLSGYGGQHVIIPPTTKDLPMVMAIDHIDKIARDLKRDVVWIAFMNNSDMLGFNRDWDSETGSRRKITKWLDENNYAWKPCGWVADESGFMAYCGQIYVDVLFDNNDEKFKLLSAYLEDENGNVKSEFPNTQFYATTLEHAMKNAYHDEPGFWEKWAENF